MKVYIEILTAPHAIIKGATKSGYFGRNKTMIPNTHKRQILARATIDAAGSSLEAHISFTFKRKINSAQPKCN